MFLIIGPYFDLRDPAWRVKFLGHALFVGLWVKMLVIFFDKSPIGPVKRWPYLRVLPPRVIKRGGIAFSTLDKQIISHYA